jgi:hypothetical protein
LSGLFSFVCFGAESCCVAAAGAPSSPGTGSCSTVFSLFCDTRFFLALPLFGTSV